MFPCRFFFNETREGKSGQGSQKAATLKADLDEVACDVPSCDVQASGQVGQREPFIHGADVGDAIAGVHHHTSQQT